MFPDIRRTVETWREYCTKVGIGDLHMVMVQTNAEGPVDPRGLGFDAAVEFPPHLVEAVHLEKEMTFFLPEFHGEVLDYESVARASVERPTPAYRLYRGIIPRWDNTPRKIRGTSVYVNDTPRAYCDWLRQLLALSRRHLSSEERLLFINAWNEWAEGAFLEPDRRYGYAYLNATARAVAQA